MGVTQDGRDAPVESTEIGRNVIIFFALFILLFLLAFWEFFFTDRVFYERDTTLVEVPARKLSVQLMKEGHFALWTDAHGNGQPFLANIKNAVFYPTSWLYLALPFFAAFKFHYLIHVLLGWLGLFILCRSYRLSHQASFLGASLFAFSGMYLSSLEFYNHIAALAWMPWILWALHRDSPGGRKRVIILVLFWTLMILAGAPEFILIALLFAAGQAFFAPGRWKRALLLTALSLVLATTISAVQLLPTLDLLGKTERSVLSTQWPLDLIQLINLPLPGIFGNNREPGHNDFWGAHLFDQQTPLYYSLYMGPGTLLLFFLGIKAFGDKRRSILLVVIAICFLLSCGRYSPFFFLYKITPLLSSIRYPIKFFMGTVFGMSILAAFGFDRAASGRGPARRTAAAIAVSAGSGILLFGLVRRPIIKALNALFVIETEPSLRELSWSIWTGLVLFAVFAAVLFFMSKSKKLSQSLGWTLLALLVLDPAFHNRAINPTVPASHYATPSIMGELPARPVIFREEFDPRYIRGRSVDSLGLWSHFRKSLYPFSGLSDGVRYVFNWDFYGAYSGRYNDLVKAFKKLPAEDRDKVLKDAGCAARIGYEPLFSHGDVTPLRVEGLDVWVEPLAASPPSPSVVFGVRRVPSSSDVTDWLSLFVDRAFDPGKSVLVDEGDLPAVTFADPTGPSGLVTVRREFQGGGDYLARLPRAGIAIFPGNAAGGWRALVDGRRTKVFAANLTSKGIWLPAGNHEIVLRYLPASFLWGAAISLASLTAILAGWLLLGKKLRRRARRASL